MPCLLLPLTSSNCPSGRAGVTKVWITENENITGFTIDSDEQVTAIAMVADSVFTQFVFEKDTAFFNQTVTRNKNNVNVAQQLSMVFPIMDAAKRKAITRLMNCSCGVTAIIKDSTGRYHVAGISLFYNPTTAAVSGSQTEQLRSGESTGNTGADPSADANEYVVVLEGNTSVLAPFTTITESTIPAGA